MRKKSVNVRYKALAQQRARPAEIVEVRPEQTVMPYDENLLERARTQWQFGDWQSLARLERATLQHHPERAKLALLAASGRLQLGRFAEAKLYVRLARDWGVSERHLCQILVAGVHNSLGRAAVVAGSFPRALKHFESSIRVGAPGSDKVLLTKARVSQQCHELGMSSAYLDGDASGALRGLPHANSAFEVVTLSKRHLGEAWAGNTINTVIFRHHGILTHLDWQITAFYVDSRTLRIVQRNLKTEAIESHDVEGAYDLNDAHNSISLGVDRSGHIHLCYGHHATRLRYRRSIRANDISGWTDELPMTGTSEERVTYPTFVEPHHGFPLVLLYRDGVHDSGDARLKVYDEETGSWSDRPLPILSGSESKPWTSNAYWNHPAIGSDGSLHVSFVWRTHTLGEEDLINNVNIGYACSFDNGVSWQTSKGRDYELPITQVNAEIIYPISPGSNLINQCSMALDSRNRPHIVFYADDSGGIPQYQHLYFDGAQWRHQIISARTQPFALRGKGTLQIPISRPEVVVDRFDNVYVITRGDHSRGRMAVTFLAAPDYLWSEKNTRFILNEDLGFAEPIIDRTRWENESVLSLLLQRNEQPAHDLDCQVVNSAVTLLDIKFTNN
ncbi:BNR repeat-containing protein [Burkholderia diffusa]|uniref:BNR repeat-containing protein n=1 Tax=Burkholderia diffusa TaxID=488732 RepID=UPI0015827882|nr:BNR repeat-containing protein [Burkholderia diffusa]